MVISTQEASIGRVLVVEDDLDMAALLRSNLEDEGFRVETCETLDRMKEKIRQYSFDAVLLDLCLGDERGVEAIPFIAREAPFTVVIVMTAFGSIELAVEAMGKGATSFLTKSGDPDRITAELKTKLLERRRGGSVATDGPSLENLGIVGQSPGLRRLVADLERIRDVDATVLITGESGTGKELVARAIHRLSPRSDQKFEALNCAAIPETLLESELFGYRRGAFTDARSDRKGIFEICSNGTLFLDEIGDMPLALQTKLLRVLQEKEVTPLGSSQAVRISTRVVAATNRDLDEEVARGRFREDLFFRLNVLHVSLPPLRDRIEDVPLLVASFVAKFNKRYNRDVHPASRELLTRLAAYPWPGNVRELENAIERAVVMSLDGELHLEDVLRAKGLRREDLGSDTALTTLSYAEAKESFERAFLLRILSAAKGSIAEAARLSGRYRSDIYRLMQRYNISPESFKD